MKTIMNVFKKLNSFISEILYWY